MLSGILRKSREAFPDKTAVISGEQQITYKELDEKSDSFACYLITKGIGRKDRVGIFLDKSIEAIVSIWAIIKTGAIFVYLDPRLTKDFISYRINKCGMKLLITSSSKLDLVDEKLRSLIVDVDDFNNISASYLQDDLFEGMITDLDIASIIFTSGSTGRPRGVVHNHKNLILWTERVASYLENNENDRILSLLPFSSSYGLSQMFTLVLAGGTLVLQRSMLPKDICNNLIDFKITGLAGVPATWMHLLQRYSPFRSLSFPHLRYITNAGGAIPERVLRQLKEILKKTKIYLMYGLTETLRSSYLDPGELDRKGVSLGKAIAGAELFILDKQGNRCKPCQEGELVHYGDTVFQGYWEDEEETNKVLKPLPFPQVTATEGKNAVWTGDIVKEDEEGFFYFVGRKDDLIKSYGYRISPLEIEEVVYKMPGIKEAVIFEEGSETGLHKIILALSLSHGGLRISQEDVARFCKNNLPNYMVPSKVIITEELPKLDSGKIDRAKIKERYFNSG